MKKDDNSITSTLKFEVVKPHDDMTWDDFGTALRALSSPLHRVMNRTITKLELEFAEGKITRKKLEKSETVINYETRAYQLVRDYWRSERQLAAERIASGKPWYLDDAVARHEPSTNGLQNGISSEVSARWAHFDKDRYQSSMTLPTFKKGAALIFSGGTNALRLENGSYVLTVILFGGRNGRVNVVVRPLGTNVYADARRIVEGLSAPEDAPSGIKLGDVKLKKKDNKWLAMVSWTRPRPTTATGSATMALHRGYRTFLTCAISGKHGDVSTKIVDNGTDIVAKKKQFYARRSELSRRTHNLGTGARGHGCARRHAHIDTLADKESKWVDTKCKQVAACVLSIAVKNQVGEILLEDWGNPASDGAPELGKHVERLVRQWPLYKLKELIIWGAKPLGIVVRDVPSDQNGRTCPRCKTLQDGVDENVRCINPECHFVYKRDTAICWNMLIKAQTVTPEAVVRSAISGRRRVKKQLLEVT